MKEVSRVVGGFQNYFKQWANLQSNLLAHAPHYWTFWLFNSFLSAFVIRCKYSCASHLIFFKIANQL